MRRIAVCNESERMPNEIVRFIDCMRGDGIRLTVVKFRQPLELLRSVLASETYDLAMVEMFSGGIQQARADSVMEQLKKLLPVMGFSRPRYVREDTGEPGRNFLYLLPDEEACCRYFREFLKPVERGSEYFSFSSGKGRHRLRKREIRYVSRLARKVSVRYGEEELPYPGSLQAAEEELADSCFFRLHKSFLVNLRHVRDIGSGHVELHDGEKLPLARGRRPAIHSRIRELEAEYRL